MESRSSSPCPGQSGQDLDREDDPDVVAAEASSPDDEDDEEGEHRSHHYDGSLLDSDSEAVAQRSAEVEDDDDDDENEECVDVEQEQAGNEQHQREDRNHEEDGCMEEDTEMGSFEEPRPGPSRRRSNCLMATSSTASQGGLHHHYLDVDGGAASSSPPYCLPVAAGRCSSSSMHGPKCTSEDDLPGSSSGGGGGVSGSFQVAMMLADDDADEMNDDAIEDGEGDDEDVEAEAEEVDNDEEVQDDDDDDDDPEMDGLVQCGNSGNSRDGWPASSSTLAVTAASGGYENSRSPAYLCRGDVPQDDDDSMVEAASQEEERDVMESSSSSVYGTRRTFISVPKFSPQPSTSAPTTSSSWFTPSSARNSTLSSSSSSKPEGGSSDSSTINSKAPVSAHSNTSTSSAGHAASTFSAGGSGPSVAASTSAVTSSSTAQSVFSSASSLQPYLGLGTLPAMFSQVHGEISNPPSPLGGSSSSARVEEDSTGATSGSSSSMNSAVSATASSSSKPELDRAESPQAGPSNGRSASYPAPESVHEDSSSITRGICEAESPSEAYLSGAADSPSPPPHSKRLKTSSVESVLDQRGSLLHSVAPVAGAVSHLNVPSGRATAGGEDANQSSSNIRSTGNIRPNVFTRSNSGGVSESGGLLRASGNIGSLGQSNNLSSSEALAAPRAVSPVSSPFLPRGHRHNLQPTIADNYLISSSTGVSDSVPPAPIDLHGDNDLSVPSPYHHYPQSPLVMRRQQNDVDDMIDSTVDSSGFSFASQGLNQTPPENDGNGVQSSHYEDSSDDDEEYGNNNNNNNNNINNNVYNDDDDVNDEEKNFADNGYLRTGGTMSLPEDVLCQDNIQSSSSSARGAAAISTSDDVKSDGHPKTEDSVATESGRKLATKHAEDGEDSMVAGQPLVAATGSSSNCELAPGRKKTNDPTLIKGYHGRNNTIYQPGSSTVRAIQAVVPAQGIGHSRSNAIEPASTSNSSVGSNGMMGSSSAGVKGVGKRSSSSRTEVVEATIAVDSLNSGCNEAATQHLASHSASTLNSHASILESMSGPLSKRLRTLHSMQQQQQQEQNQIQQQDYLLHSQDHVVVVVNHQTGTDPGARVMKKDISKLMNNVKSDQPASLSSSCSSSTESSTSFHPQQQPPVGVNGGTNGDRTVHNQDLNEAAASLHSSDSATLKRQAALASMSSSSSSATSNDLPSSIDQLLPDSLPPRPPLPPHPPPPPSSSSSSSSSRSSGPDLGGIHQTYSVTIGALGASAVSALADLAVRRTSVTLNASDKNTISSVLDRVIHPLEDERKGMSAAFLTGSSLSSSSSTTESLLTSLKSVGLKDSYPNESVIKIQDRPVPSRAMASLPSNYLSLKHLPALVQTQLKQRCQRDRSRRACGVFAKKLLPKSCRFGPVEGVLRQHIQHNNNRSRDPFLQLVQTKSGCLALLDVSDEGHSNWMRFVRPARTSTEQNLELNQDGDCLYYITSRSIQPKEELRIWYSKAYADCFGLNHLPASQSESNDEAQSFPEELLSSPFDDPSHSHLASNCGGQPVDIDRNSSDWPLRSLSTVDASHLHEDFEAQSIPRIPPFSSPTVDEGSGDGRDGEVREVPEQGENCFAPTSLHPSIDCRTCGISFESPTLVELRSKDSQLQSNEVCPKCVKSLDEDKLLKDAATTHQGRFNLKHDLYNGHHATHRHQPAVSARHDSILQRNTSIVKIFKEKRRPHKCEQCYRSFSNSERLRSHMAVHGSDESKPIACLECGKRFTNKSALACHSKVHCEEVESYDCPICGELFDQIHPLKEHIHIHRENNVYRCPTCHKVFPEYSMIRKHIRSFHSDKKFFCHHCGRSFTASDKLKAHMVKHSDLKQFSCEDCPKRFKRKDKLKEHVRRMHSNNDSVPPERKLRARHRSSLISSKKRSVGPPAPLQDRVDLGLNRDNHAAVASENGLAVDSAVNDILGHGTKSMTGAGGTEYEKCIFKCRECMLGFKRRGMLVNHLAKRHPKTPLNSVPELCQPIMKAEKDFYCQYCNKVYKSSSKRKSHILKNHPGAKLPLSARDGAKQLLVQSDGEGVVDRATFSATVGSIESEPFKCCFCPRQYASNAKLLQHKRLKHKRSAPHSNNGVVVRKLPGQDHQPDAENASTPGPVNVAKPLTLTAADSRLQPDNRAAGGPHLAPTDPIPVAEGSEKQAGQALEECEEEPPNSPFSDSSRGGIPLHYVVGEDGEVQILARAVIGPHGRSFTPRSDMSDTDEHAQEDQGHYVPSGHTVEGPSTPLDHSGLSREPLLANNRLAIPENFASAVPSNETARSCQYQGSFGCSVGGQQEALTTVNLNHIGNTAQAPGQGLRQHPHNQPIMSHHHHLQNNSNSRDQGHQQQSQAEKEEELAVWLKSFYQKW